MLGIWFQGKIHNELNNGLKRYIVAVKIKKLCFLCNSIDNKIPRHCPIVLYSKHVQNMPNLVVAMIKQKIMSIVYFNSKSYSEQFSHRMSEWNMPHSAIAMVIVSCFQ